MRLPLFMGVAVMLAAPVAQAQDQIPMQTDQLDRHADVVRQKMLRDATVGRNRGKATPPGNPTRQQQAACAGKERFRAQYGADNPKVRRLYELCRGVGL